MKQIKIESDKRDSTKKEKITPMMAGVINNSNLYEDKDGYAIHTGVINRRDWHMMLIQLLSRGYTTSEAYKEIHRLGINPNRDSTIYNFLSSLKKNTKIKFRIDSMTQIEINRLNRELQKAKKIPRNVSDKAGGKMASFTGYSDILDRREKGGRPLKGDERKADPVFSKDEIDLLRKLKRR